MNILAFVDTHGERRKFDSIIKKSEDADIILCAGDLTVFDANLREFLEKLNNLNKYTLIIHGNHETDESMRAAAKGLNSIKVIHRKVFKFRDLYVFGWGGGGFTETDPELEKKGDKYARVLKGKKFIFMTHGPPHRTNVDLVNQAHVGCKTIRKFIEKNQPAINICGHIHEGSKKQDKIGKTLIINPGPDGTILKLK
ncbi:MAG: metallophosphoesterase family protein [Nanoarchaeota archaeon]|nr:metallophosphoesterase family protein [Nanoarchaeota archaeon]